MHRAEAKAHVVQEGMHGGEGIAMYASTLGVGVEGKRGEEKRGEEKRREEKRREEKRREETRRDETKRNETKRNKTRRDGEEMRLVCRAECSRPLGQAGNEPMHPGWMNGWMSGQVRG